MLQKVRLAECPVLRNGFLKEIKSENEIYISLPLSLLNINQHKTQFYCH